MSTEPSVLVRNTSYFTLALVAQKVISFLYFTFLARLLGPESIGRYVFALSLTTLFSVLLDLGLSNVLTRQVAREPSQASRYVRLVIGFKLTAMIAVVGLAVVFVWLAGYPILTRQLVYIASVIMVLDSFTLTAYSTIRGLHNLSWESIGTVLMQVVLAGVGVTVSFFTFDLRWFMAALGVAALVNCFYSLWQLRWRYNINLKPLWDKVDYKFIAKLTWPFALAAILTRIYGYLDTIILSLLQGDRAVGIYSVAYKITFALQFIPAAFSASLFPGFSFYYQVSNEKLSQTFMRGLVYLTGISVPISLGIIAIAPEMIAVVYPAFKDSILPLQILIFSLIWLFMTYPLGALLPACDRQLRQTGNLALAAGSNLIFNLFLIPLFGPVGAATASLLSTVILLIAGWLVAKNLVTIDHKFLYVRISKIILAGLFMFVFANLFKGYLGLLLVIIFSAFIYTLLLVSLGGVTWQEIKQLIKVIFRRQVA